MLSVMIECSSLRSSSSILEKSGIPARVCVVTILIVSINPLLYCWDSLFFSYSLLPATSIMEAGQFGKLLAPEVFSNHHALYLAGAFTDFIDFHTAPVTRDGKFVHEAIAAVYLHRLIGSAFGSFRGKELGYRGLSRIRFALHVQPGSFIIH